MRTKKKATEQRAAAYSDEEFAKATGRFVLTDVHGVTGHRHIQLGTTDHSAGGGRTAAPPQRARFDFHIQQTLHRVVFVGFEERSEFRDGDGSAQFEVRHSVGDGGALLHVVQKQAELEAGLHSTEHNTHTSRSRAEHNTHSQVMRILVPVHPPHSCPSPS